jgi:hypothetical protein
MGTGRFARTGRFCFARANAGGWIALSFVTGEHRRFAIDSAKFVPM